MNWIELHTDTDGSEGLSFLDGARLVSLCARNGCGAVACTDRNSVLSYLPMERAAEREGIRLIYGATLDCVDLDDRYAVTLLARNETGRRNLFALMGLLEENRAALGRCVTRRQLEDHRAGLLLGASGADGQLVRAIQLRRGSRRLRQIAEGYDYLEVPLEPYDTVARLLRLSGEIAVPLCAVQSARLGPKPTDGERHAFQAIAYDRGRGERPDPYLPPKELAERFRARYALPGEREGLERALSQGWQLLEQLQPLEPLGRLLERNTARAEGAWQGQLRAQAEEALRRRYGDRPGEEIAGRLRWELERVERLHMAGQVLLLEAAAEADREAGGRMAVDGPWNSSFLLSLLGITELNPLPGELGGLDLCPVSLLGTETPVLSACVRLPEELIPRVRGRLAERYGARMLQLCRGLREPKAEEETLALIEGYLHESCPAEAGEALRANGAFYGAVSRHSGELRWDPAFSALYLLPEEADPLALPAVREGETGLLTMGTMGFGQLEHTPCITLLDSPVQRALARCEARTGAPIREVPLDDGAVYEALAEVYRSGAGETPVAAACALLGVKISPFTAELYGAMEVRDLRGLTRFMSLSHGGGLWQENQQPLLQSGAVEADRLITCREDVYRYLRERGAPPDQAAAFMEQVRAGKLARAGCSEAQRALLERCRAEDWFIRACEKIQYLFPEAHSAEYALSLVRLVWYACRHPEAAPLILGERDGC